MCSRRFCADDGRRVPILTLGPIGILPGFQRQGYGRILLEASLEKAASLGWGAVCLEGNIRFYGKSGFVRASQYGVRYCGLSDGADDSFFLLKELIPGYLEGITGVYAPPQVYFVKKADADAFDAAFPPGKGGVCRGSCSAATNNKPRERLAVRIDLRPFMQSGLEIGGTAHRRAFGRSADLGGSRYAFLRL